MRFSALELAALDQITSQRVPGMEVVREHLRAATVTSREFTGLGFHTRFEVAPGVPVLLNTLELRQAFMRGADARVRGDPEELICFKLWENQRRADKGTLELTTLEGQCTKGPWPENDSLVEVVREPAA